MKKYLLVDSCYIGENELNTRYGSPVATYHTGDGQFWFGEQSVTVDSGIIHVYAVPPNENVILQGDLADHPFAEIAYLENIPTQKEIDSAVNEFLYNDSAE